MPGQRKIKHILFLQNTPPFRVWGGLEKLMMEWFERIDYSQFKVTFVVSKGWAGMHEKKLKAKNIPVNMVEFPFEPVKGAFWKRFWNMFFFINTLRPSSVVFVQGWLFSFDFAHILAGFFVTPGEVYMHENLGPPPMLPKTSKRYLGGMIPGFGIWWHIKKYAAVLRASFSRKIIVVSHEIKEKLVAGWYYPAEKIFVHHHGVDTKCFCPSPEIRLKMRASLQIPPREVVIMVTARLSKEKCIQRIIEAFDVLSQESSELTLFIAGNGPLEKELKTLAQSKSSASKIKFLGHVDDVAAHLQMSDIYVLSSDNEGFGIALVEAMATGLICVATKCAGPNEIIQDGINGFLVEKSTKGVREGLKRALALSGEEKIAIRKRTVSFIAENFELNERVQRVFIELGLSDKKDIHLLKGATRFKPIVRSV